MRLTSSAFWLTRIVEALRLRGCSIFFCFVSSSSSFDSPDVRDGTSDFGEESIGGSSGIQCAVVFVRMSNGLCCDNDDMIAAADGTND